MGHLLLCGDSGAGKTVLSRFVSWMNGLNIFQIKAHSRYGAEDFFEDLRTVMKRVGCDGEKITFIFDESNVLSSGFLEAMNALLASGEVPGLFESGEEYNALMNACRDSAARGTLSPLHWYRAAQSSCSFHSKSERWRLEESFDHKSSLIQSLRS